MGANPEEFWWPELAKYKAGGGCVPPPMPLSAVCPATLPHSHRAVPDGCCLASYSPACGQACEEAACNATAGWHWEMGLNYSHDLYTCCPVESAPPSPTESDSSSSSLSSLDPPSGAVADEAAVASLRRVVVHCPDKVDCTEVLQAALSSKKIREFSNAADSTAFYFGGSKQ